MLVVMAKVRDVWLCGLVGWVGERETIALIGLPSSGARERTIARVCLCCGLCRGMYNQSKDLFFKES